MSSTSSNSIFSVPANPSEPSEPGPGTTQANPRPRRSAHYFDLCENNKKTPLLWSVMAYAAGATYPGSIIRTTSASDCRPRDDEAPGIGRFMGSLRRDRRHSWVFVRRAGDQPAVSPGANLLPSTPLARPAPRDGIPVFRGIGDNRGLRRTSAESNPQDKAARGDRDAATAVRPPTLPGYEGI